MKHKFLLDENILFYAIRVEDEHGMSIPEASKFVGLVWSNCHIISIDRVLNRLFIRHLKTLRENRRQFKLRHQVFDSILQFYRHSQKRDLDLNSEIPPIPDEDQYPRKDIHIVRAASFFRADVVAVDGDLATSINNSPYFQGLGLRAFHPRDALVLAQDT